MPGRFTARSLFAANSTCLACLGAVVAGLCSSGCSARQHRLRLRDLQVQIELASARFLRQRLRACSSCSGAGTSGRLAHFVSAVFNSVISRGNSVIAPRREVFRYLIAGGDAALLRAQVVSACTSIGPCIRVARMDVYHCRRTRRTTLARLLMTSRHLSLPTRPSPPASC